MQNGNASVRPALKTPPPALAHWTPPEEEQEQSGNFLGAKAKKIYINDNINSVDRVVLCFAEFLGTGILVFLGCMGCVGNPSVGDQEKISFVTQIAFTFGLAIMVSVQCFGHISGSHINPAVTLASVVLGHTPIMHIPLYLIGQMLGAVGGFGLLKLISQSDTNEIGDACSPGPLGGLKAWQGAVVEGGLTFILVMVCASSWDCRNSTKQDSLSLRIGLTITVLVLAGAPFTGAHLNPARSFGPALLNGTWDNWWVWWVGPLLGGLLAGLVYRFAFSKEQEVFEHTAAEIIHMNDRP